jgi:hypothetical protein
MRFEMEKHCIACGMPLSKAEDVAVEIEQGPVCTFCANKDGTVKSCKEIFEGGVHFFNNSVPNLDKEMAERITLKNMKQLPYWQGKACDCFKGEEATDEEFKKALSDLHEEIEKGNVK